MANRKKYYLYFFLLVCLVLSCYAHTLNAPFIFDDEFILDALKHRSLWELMHPILGGLRPFYKFSLKMNYLISGDDPWSYHLVNILIHITNSILIFEIIRQTLLLPNLKTQLKKHVLEISFISSLLWGIHPIHTQAVTYIAQRCEIMMAMFYLISLLLLIRSFTTSRNRALYQILAIIAFTCGLGSKEAMISAPIIIFLYDWIFLSKTFKKTFTAHWIFYSGIFILFLIPFSYLLSVGKLSYYTGYITGKYGVTPHDYILTQSEVVLHYIKLSVLPYSMCFNYDWKLVNSLSQVVVPLAIWALIFILIIKLMRRNIYLSFPLLFCLINLLPRSLITSPHAAVDYRMYLPLAGLIVFYVLSIFILFQYLSKRKNKYKEIINALSYIVPIAFIIIFLTVTFLLNNLYNNPLKLWEKEVQSVPNNYHSWNYYGIELSKRKRFKEARLCFLKSLKIMPGNILALNNLGNTYAETGEFDTAISFYYESLSINENKDIIRKLKSSTHNNLARIFSKRKEFTKAAFHYLEAIRLGNKDATLFYELGSLFQQQGQFKEAKVYLTKAVKTDNSFIYAYNDLGLISIAEQHYPKAEEYFRKAIDINPGYVAARLNLANLLEIQGEKVEAIKHRGIAQELIKQLKK